MSDNLKRADKWGKGSKYTDFSGNFGENMPATGLILHIRCTYGKLFLSDWKKIRFS